MGKIESYLIQRPVAYGWQMEVFIEMLENHNKLYFIILIKILTIYTSFTWALTTTHSLFPTLAPTGERGLYKHYKIDQ